MTDLGREQARTFARALVRPPALLAHSIATRAVQTAAHIATEIGGVPAVPHGLHEFEGLHEVQVGELEDRSDEAAHDEFNTIYRRWHRGELDLALPGGETARQVLERYVPVLDQLRRQYLEDAAWRGDIVVVSHGAAIRLVAAALAGVDGGFAIDHHLANTESVVLAPVTDGRWSCVQWGKLTPRSAPRRPWSPRRRRAQPIRWAETIAVSSQTHPTAPQSMCSSWTLSATMQSSSVHSARRKA